MDAKDRRGGKRVKGGKEKSTFVLFKWMGNDSLGFADNYTVGFNQFCPFTVWRGLIPRHKGPSRGGAVPEKAPSRCK
jgi:hypothetical protein